MCAFFWRKKNEQISVEKKNSSREDFLYPYWKKNSNEENNFLGVEIIFFNFVKNRQNSVKKKVGRSKY